MASESAHLGVTYICIEFSTGKVSVCHFNDGNLDRHVADPAKDAPEPLYDYSGEILDPSEPVAAQAPLKTHSIEGRYFGTVTA